MPDADNEGSVALCGFQGTTRNMAGEAVPGVCNLPPHGDEQTHSFTVSDESRVGHRPEREN